MNRQEVEKLTSEAELSPRDVYGRLLDPGAPYKTKSPDERMNILFNALEESGMEVVRFGYPTSGEQFVTSDLVSILSDYNFISLPRLIVRPKPPKNYHYVTDGIERYPKEGDYVYSYGIMMKYIGQHPHYFRRLCFTREEVKD
jgi:hypothetical protein